MDLFERIVDLHTERGWFEGMSAEEQQAVFAPERYEVFKAQKQAEEAAQLEMLRQVYRMLSLEQARMVAREALAYYDRQPDDQDYLVIQIWSRLVNYVPGALIELHHDLLDRQITWAAGFLFCGAQASVRDRMLALIEAETTDEQRRSEWLAGLGWIGDGIVQQRFAAWQQHPPQWDRPRYRVPRYAYHGGWELTSDGGRRDLCSQACYALIPLEQATAEQLPGPVGVIAPTQESCRWCHRPLVALFDLDLRDPRVHFLAIRGERLRLSMCSHCSVQARVYTDFDLAGHTAWSGINSDQPPEHLYFYEKEDVLTLPQERLVLGSPRRTPYETNARYWEPGLSQLGGMPEWVQNPEYPRCPACKQTMMFVGQVEPRDLVWAEGIIYGFVCVPCGKATTGYQQT